MGTEIEKKYRVTAEETDRLRARLREVGAEARGAELEENTLFGGPALAPRGRVLRLRRVGGRAVLTYKERHASASAVKRQREEETEVADPDALTAIFAALGFTPTLVYEKRRETWGLGGAEVVLDELPFGLFVEIEGAEESIYEAERLLGLASAEAEHASYPELTRRHGVKKGELTAARFGGGGSTP